MKNEKVYILRILDSVSKIESFIKDQKQEIFLSDQKTQSAIIMQLVVIGEDARKISEETRLKVELPWFKILGFRNMAVHEYFNISLKMVWKTVVEEIPTLKTELQKYLDSKK